MPVKPNTPKRTAGRKPKPGGRQVAFWSNVKQIRYYEKAAKKAGLSRSAWIKRTLDDAAGVK